MIFEIVLFLIIIQLTYRLVTLQGGQFFVNLASDFGSSPVTHDERLERLEDVARRYYEEKKFLAAEKAYLKVLKLDHRNLTAYSRLGFIYTQMGNAADAIECFNIVIEHKPSAAAYHNLAMAYFKEREFKKSAENLEKALEIEPTQVRLINLARIYRIIGDYTRQVQILERASQAEPDNVSVLLLLAESHLHNKDEAQAKATFRKILKVDPNNSRARQALNK
jgi:tetratricopeptide (TPR) repeat protein